jgi:predicted Zn-dependent peptidase
MATRTEGKPEKRSVKKQMKPRAKSVLKDSSLIPEFRKTVLPNGIRVLTEKHPTSRAVSCGIWVSRGTRDEFATEAGLAHFVEHLVFKRTKKRSAYEIARDMEAVGGELNAYTSRESTTFVTHSLKDHLALSLDVLSDLVASPGFHPLDIKKEKQVVIQEINMAEDQLEDYIFDEYFKLVFPDSPLGKPILGTRKSIEGMKRETILDYHRRQFTGRNMLVTVAGNVEHDEVLKLVLKHLKGIKESPAASVKKTRAEAPSDRVAPEMWSFREVIQRPAEQVHILMGMPGTSFKDRLRFEGYIVNTLLGGGMTSRLYQTVREEKGLVYSIFSSLNSFTDAGLMMIYAGTEPMKAPHVVELILKEVKRLKKNGIKKADLEFFKTQVLGQVLLGADDIDNRMNSLGVNDMVLGRYRSVENVMRDIRAVTLDSVHEYIEKYLDLEQTGILLMGATPENATRRWLESI